MLGPSKPNAAAPSSRTSNSVAWLSPNCNRAGALHKLAVSGHVTHGRPLPVRDWCNSAGEGGLCVQMVCNLQECVTLVGPDWNDVAYRGSAAKDEKHQLSSHHSRW